MHTSEIHPRPSPEALNPGLSISGPGQCKQGETLTALKPRQANSMEEAIQRQNSTQAAQIPLLPPLTTESGALRPPRSGRRTLLASQGMGSKMEDAHPSGVKWQPWIRYSLLRMTRLAKTGNYPNAINSRREKNFDAIYSQSGISYTSENGKKY